MLQLKLLGSADSLAALTQVLFKNRNLLTPQAQQTFLNPPKLNYYTSAFSEQVTTALQVAATTIKTWMAENRHIIVHGDYDADGVCATAILYTTLTKELGYGNVSAFIPNRQDHGYGLTVKSFVSAVAVANYPADRVGLITVDCGITAVEAVAYVKQQGAQVILTDHHQKPAILPNADVLVWTDQVVGTTIAWLLSLVLGSKTVSNLVYCGIATLTDVAPLTDINRVLVKKSLQLLTSSPPLGLKKLIASAGLAGKPLTTYDIGFIIGPRLNASGRIALAKDALDLLISDDVTVVEDLADKLNAVNAKRQDKTVEMYDAADEFSGASLPRVLISLKPEYHEGIIGLVAARLTQKYYRPAVVMSLEDGFAKGSVRSIKGINIIEVLRKFEDLFLSLGGHPMAAGFSIKQANIPVFTKALVDYLDQSYPAETFVQVLEVDAELPFSLLTDATYELVSAFAPFGIGNPEPVFISRKANFISSKYVGKDQAHAVFQFATEVGQFKAMLFNASQKTELPSFQLGQPYDLVYRLMKNTFQGKSTLELSLVDLSPST